MLGAGKNKKPADIEYARRNKTSHSTNTCNQPRCSPGAHSIVTTEQTACTTSPIYHAPPKSVRKPRHYRKSDPAVSANDLPHPAETTANSDVSKSLSGINAISTHGSCPVPRIFQWNIDGILRRAKTHQNKLKFLDEFVNSSDMFIPFFLITESHLKSYHLDAEVAISKYIIIRSDRPDKTKGGVALFLHNSLISDHTEIHTDGYCSSVMIYIMVTTIFQSPFPEFPEF